MRSTKRTDSIISMILLCTVLSGCMLLPGASHREEIANGPAIGQERRPDTFVVYFFRELSYKGLGRIHELRLDGKPIGQLTADDYYRIELWPGDYILSVYLPEENFLGTISPAENTSIRITLSPMNAPEDLIYKYIDGDGIHRVESVDDMHISRLITTRTASANLSARETAQVKHLFDARYDGPAKFGKAHGNATLTWDDGSVFRGRFEYGRLTEDGKFFDTRGTIYMGPKTKGRPIGPGVLTTAAGRILYAGKFKNEIPHGVGIRSGAEGPEFCVYDNGEDVTKTIWQLTNEALEEEDERRAEKDIQSPTVEKETLLPKNKIIYEEKSAPAAAEESVAADAHPDSAASIEEKTFLSSEGNKENPATPLVSEEKKKIDTQIPVTREDRARAKYKEINLSIKHQIEEKQAWCIEELEMGHQLCICAPFAADFESWAGCSGQ